ncbi:MAG TPA: Trm112 family protein [Ohtaekwangia sp.]|nr:Trm112 family protein [Ohtaekwangia sp.]
MKQNFLNKLACPFDKRDLSVKIFKQDQEEIKEGILICSHCQRYYPIVHGIPVMSPDEYRQVELEIPLLARWGETLLIKNGKPVFELAEENQLEK